MLVFLVRMKWNGRLKGSEVMQPAMEVEGEVNLRDASIPPTSFSDTFLSTVFAASLTVSVALFWAAKQVEKARGAKVEARGAKRRVVLERKDILI